MDVFDAISLFNKAISKREEEKLWDLYLIHFKKMDKENYISFEDYKARIFTPKDEIELSHETVEDTFNRFKAKVGMK